MSTATLLRVLAVFMFFGGATAIYIGITEMDSGRASVSWPAVSGVVKEVEYSKDDRVLYSYEFEGRNYEDDTWGFGLSRGNTPYLRKGDHVSVYVNPASPQQATLKTGFGRGVWFCLVIGAGIVFGSFMFAVVSINCPEPLG